MRTKMKMSSAALLLSTPLAAYAEIGAPHIELYAFGGSLVGGFFGALVACWLCKRRGSKTDGDHPTKN